MKRIQSLQALVKLSHKVAVFVPTRDTHGIELDKTIAQDTLDSTLTILSNSFGGATASQAIGCWIGVNGLVKENVVYVFAYAKALDETLVNRIIDHCRHIKAQCNQEAIALEVDGELYFL